MYNIDYYIWHDHHLLEIIPWIYVIIFTVSWILNINFELECELDYSQVYLEIVQFSRLATICHFMNSDCFLCHYNLLLQSFWKDIHLFFLPNCVSFIVDWYQRLRCFWQMTHRHRYWKIRSKSISLALQKFRIKVDVIANVDRPYNGKMHLLPY